MLIVGSFKFSILRGTQKQPARSPQMPQQQRTLLGIVYQYTLEKKHETKHLASFKCEHIFPFTIHVKTIGKGEQYVVILCDTYNVSFISFIFNGDDSICNSI